MHDNAKNSQCVSEKDPQANLNVTIAKKGDIHESIALIIYFDLKAAKACTCSYPTKDHSGRLLSFSPVVSQRTFFSTQMLSCSF
jgi:hypothetical protein